MLVVINSDYQSIIPSALYNDLGVDVDTGVGAVRRVAGRGVSACKVLCVLRMSQK